MESFENFRITNYQYLVLTSIMAAKRVSSQLTHPNQMEIRCERQIQSQVSEEDFGKIINLILSNREYTRTVFKNFHVDEDLILRAIRCDTNSSKSAFIANFVSGLECFHGKVLSTADQTKTQMDHIWYSLSTQIFFNSTYTSFVKALIAAQENYVEGTEYSKVVCIFSVPLNITRQGVEIRILMGNVVTLVQTALRVLYPRKGSETNTLSETRKTIINHCLSIWPKDLPTHNLLQTSFFTQDTDELLKLILDYNCSNADGPDVVRRQINILIHILEIFTKKSLLSKIQSGEREISELELLLVGPYLATIFKIDVDIFEVASNQTDNPGNLGFRLDTCYNFKPIILLNEENKSTYQVYQRSGQKIIMILRRSLNIYYLVIPGESTEDCDQPWDDTSRFIAKVTIREKYMSQSFDMKGGRMAKCSIALRLHWYANTELYWSCSPRWLKKTLLSRGAGIVNQKKIEIPKKIIDEICTYRKSNLSLRSLIDNPNHLTDVGFYIKTPTHYAFVGNFKLTKQIDLSHALPVAKNMFIFEFNIVDLEKVLQTTNLEYQKMIGHIGSQILSHSCLEKTKASYPWVPPMVDKKKNIANVPQEPNPNTYFQRFYNKVLYVKYSTGIVKVVSVQQPNALEDIHFHIPNYLAYGKRESVPETLALVFFTRKVSEDKSWDLMQIVQVLATMIG